MESYSILKFEGFGWDMAAHTFYPRTQADLCKFKGSLVYIAARVTNETLSKKKKVLFQAAPWINFEGITRYNKPATKRQNCKLWLHT